jgi:type IX secretion system PorP/SprF family membrane protein
MRKILITITIGLATVAYGQQMPQFSQYLRNQYMVNPGAAGMYDFLDITLGGRMQWLGFNNAPKTSYLYASSALSKRPKVRYNPSLRTSNGPIRNPEIKTGKLKHAVGGILLADEYGAYRQLKIAGTYALHIPVAQNYNLSFGVNIGVSNRAFLKDRAQTLNMMTGVGTDPTYDIYSQETNSNTMDVGAGMYFYSDRLFVGISADQLTRDYVSFGSGTVNFDPNMHFYATAGYKIGLNDNLSLMPAVLVKYMGPAPLSIEGSLQFEYKEWLWMGLTYRNQDAIVAMAGLNISRRFKLGYSFDYSVSRFNNYSSGGHELILGIMLGR